MSKNQMVHIVSRELSNLNRQIDEKIVRGVSYDRDARRHKILLAQLAGVRRRERFAQRVLGFLSFL